MSKSFIKGTYSKSIFQTDAGYHVGLFRVKEASCDLEEFLNKTITFTGYFHELNNIDYYLFSGELVEHEKYGEQFRVDSYERVKPEEKDSIVEFLTSGLFPGIGEKKAKKIVDTLGEDTLKVILENPSNLVLIPTITEKNINILHSKLKEYESSYETIVYLNDIGFSTKDSMIIYNKYKDKTKTIVEDNIYRLIDDIYEMNFKKIDTISIRNGNSIDDPNRVCAAIIYIMQEISNTYGHCYYSKEEILSYLPRVIGIEIIDIDKYLSTLEMDLKIIIKEDKIYLKDIYEAETSIVKRFRRLNNNPDSKLKKIDEVISEVESFFEIKYNDLQIKAIKKSLEKDFLIITGGPGTGKTTILRGILETYRMINKLSYEKLCNKVALLSPTGRAAKRMTEATLIRASTIHRFLKWQRESDTFLVNEYNKSDVELVIIDEVSMIDTLLMSNLLKGLSANCKIILVGDDHQLPSVGAGDVLHDLIESKKLEVVELTEIYRQGIDSNIISLAYDIRSGNINRNIFNINEDLTFIECLDNEVLTNISEICNTYYDLNYHKFQILAPMYKGINGIDSINKQVQNIYNPKSNKVREREINGFTIRENDKVIQLTNMPDDNVYNGDIGLIEWIVTSPKNEIHINFDSNVVKYTPSNFNDFRLAYAISIHKAQGSEFDVVVLPIVKGYSRMLYQKLIYTAVTRAKKKLYLIGDFKALEYASSNSRDNDRRTTIKKYLIDGID